MLLTRPLQLLHKHRPTLLNPSIRLSSTAVLDSTTKEINHAMSKAASAFPIFSSASTGQVSTLLHNIAQEIEALGDELIDTAVSESSLPEPRIRGETARTTGQLRAFAALVEQGSWVDARLDVGGGTGRDIRRMLRPLGPAVVFGASNFPLAFSVAGGDTAAALAAKCPVVHKAHPAHPRTCELVSGAIKRAVSSSGLPEGTFSMVQGASPRVGQELVAHPHTKVGGFTGSLHAGRALFDIANARPNPIPFYAEMGSVNPVVVLPGALGSKWEQIAAGLAGSVTLGAGQFCTNPGLVFTAPGTGCAKDATMVSKFITEVARHVDNIPPSAMLTEHIHQEYIKNIDRMAIGVTKDIQIKTKRKRGSDSGGIVLHVSGAVFLKHAQELQEEVFGPSTLIVEFENQEQLNQGLVQLKGQLTATIWGNRDDFQQPSFSTVLQLVTERVGRVLFNGLPTGVEVCSAMVHGGPYPASSIDETSVGTEAIRRFTRPVCYQDCPDSLLPIELQDANAHGIFRKVNNEYTTEGVLVEEFTKKTVV
jgi:alpha-ketoglutaric semialdehyde dehydrogenase